VIPERNLGYRRHIPDMLPSCRVVGDLKMRREALLDEQLIELLRTIVEECWNSLPRDQRGSKEDMIARVFDCAECGERDPERLKRAAASVGPRP
jgi:hypothetical protein